MGRNFIGAEELSKVSQLLGIKDPLSMNRVIPAIPFQNKKLTELKDNYILILGFPLFHDESPLTICKFRSFRGTDPKVKEPCLYNQDWYLNESFANECTLELRWYLVRKRIIEESRGSSINTGETKDPDLPSALLLVYTFFANYYTNNGEILWPHDYLWCSDLDHNGDQIYTGRYLDPEKINKNGFSIHRHLSIRMNYGIADSIKEQN